MATCLGCRWPWRTCWLLAWQRIFIRDFSGCHVGSFGCCLPSTVFQLSSLSKPSTFILPSWRSPTYCFSPQSVLVFPCEWSACQATCAIVVQCSGRSRLQMQWAMLWLVLPYNVGALESRSIIAWAAQAFWGALCSEVPEQQVEKRAESKIRDGQMVGDNSGSCFGLWLGAEALCCSYLGCSLWKQVTSLSFLPDPNNNSLHDA